MLILLKVYLAGLVGGAVFWGIFAWGMYQRRELKTVPQYIGWVAFNAIVWFITLPLVLWNLAGVLVEIIGDIRGRGEIEASDDSDEDCHLDLDVS